MISLTKDNIYNYLIESDIVIIDKKIINYIPKFNGIISCINSFNEYKVIYDIKYNYILIYNTNKPKIEIYDTYIVINLFNYNNIKIYVKQNNFKEIKEIKEIEGFKEIEEIEEIEEFYDMNKNLLVIYNHLKKNKTFI